MLVKPEQLVPGCVLIKNVMGKTNQPLMPEQTVLTDRHIKVLQKFLVESVDVSQKLSDGELFKPKDLRMEQKKEKPFENLDKLSLNEHYKLVIKGYRSMFQNWQNQLPVDMVTVRKLIAPLLERICENDAFIFQQLCREDPKNIYSHAVSLSVLSAYVGMKMGYEKGKWMQIGFAAFLADAGFSKIKRELLTPGPSTSQADGNETKKHPVYSYRMIEKLPTLTREAKLAVLQHHEQLDGSGYPLGLPANNINSFAKILSFCDTYYIKMTKKGISPFTIIDNMMKMQAPRFDQQAVRTLAKQLVSFTKDKKVRLSDGRIGEVVFMEVNGLRRPMIRDTNSDNIDTLGPSTVIEEILG